MNGEPRRRMVDWTFDARRHDGSMRAVTFYALTKVEALKLARAWAKRTGHAIEPMVEEAA